MNTSTYQQEQKLFERALGHPPGAERQAFLDAACAGNPALRQSLDELLQWESEADALFAGTSHTLASLASLAPLAPDPSGTNPAIGTSIGPYKILELIGEGGCGSVFVAEQHEPFHRRVALKIVRVGMDTRAMISRFEAERQALARMDHPNIAHVIDAGTTHNGLPYFVMELVQGCSITRFCEENQLSIRERLWLFVNVCNAIQHAHQKGVIHRDIKPSNILITLHDGKPFPKIIDFGIAKTTGIPAADSPHATQHLQMIGTPAYMSPEQAEQGGQELDTRSDIYSLGVLLYELLTGSPPFDPKQLAASGMSAMLRTLLETDPPRPSALLAGKPRQTLHQLARLRATDASGLLHAVRGDLDWIVSKAMEKNRSRRYESAHGLASDIRRHLAHEPVVARPPTRRYVMAKMIRRNRAVFASGVVMTTTLLLATILSTRLYLRERESHRGLVEAKIIQTELREEADRRREQADRLRHLAETRERITQAVVFLRDGNYPAADALVAGAPVIRPSPEGAHVFRRLGEWHEANGRWREAADRFSYLVHVNSLDPSDIPSLDHLRAGTVWVESGDLAGYETFRRSMIQRYAGTADMRSAERTVKVALLLPADEELMRELEPLIDASARSLLAAEESHDEQETDGLAAWRMTSIALGEYRRGRFREAELWCRKCLPLSADEPSREATARVLLALALHRIGHTIEAREHIETARAILPAHVARDVEDEHAFNGWWPDWLIVRILLREAEALLHSSTATGNPR